MPDGRFLIAGAPQPETVDGWLAGGLSAFIDRMAVQEHLHFIEPARQHAILVRNFAIDQTTGDGGNGLGNVVDRNIQPEIPAAGGGDVELADVGKFGIQRGDEGARFVFVELESAGVGQNDAFVMKAQMHRVGTQPVTVIDGLLQ